MTPSCPQCGSTWVEADGSRWTCIDCMNVWARWSNPCASFLECRRIHDELLFLYSRACTPRYACRYTGEPIRRGALCQWMVGCPTMPHVCTPSHVTRNVTAPRAHAVLHEPTNAQRAFEAADAAWWDAGCPLTGPLSDAWDRAWRAWQGGPCA